MYLVAGEADAHVRNEAELFLGQAVVLHVTVVVRNGVFPRHLLIDALPLGGEGGHFPGVPERV